MEFVFWILNLPIFINLPDNTGSWIVWGLGIILILVLMIGFRKFIFHVQRRRMWLFLIFLILQPILSLGINLKLDSELGAFNLIPLLSGVPGILAAGLIGSIPSVILAFVAGLFSALWVTHSIFDPIVFILFTLFINWAINQNYKSRFFSAVRHPIVSSTIGLLLYFPVILIIQLITSRTNPTNFLSSGFSGFLQVVLPFIGNIFIASIVAEVLYRNKKSTWFMPKTFINAPLDKNSPRKFIILSVLMGVLLSSLGVYITWQASISQTTSLLSTQLDSISTSIQAGIPVLINYGKDVFSYPASILKETGIANSSSVLADYYNQQAFYKEIYLLDETGSIIQHFPGSQLEYLSNEDEARILDAFNRESFQFYPIDYGEEKSAGLTFLYPLVNSAENLNGFLLGRISFEENLQALLLFNHFNSLELLEGKAELTDEFGRAVISVDWTGTVDFKDSTANIAPINNEDNLVKTLILKNPPWRLTLTIPAHSIIAQAKNLAIPNLIVLIVILLTYIFVFYYFVRSYYQRIVGLNRAISETIKNKIDFKNPLDTIDEIGILGESIQVMNYQNKEAIFDQVALLRTSTAIIQMQELETIVLPVFDALLRKGCDSVRMILRLPGQEKQTLSRGSATSLYNHLDEPILDAINTQANLILPHVVRNRGLVIPAGSLVPGSLAAFSIEQHENVIGALWIAFQEPIIFQKEEIAAIVALKNELQKSIDSYSQIAKLRQSQLEFESLLHLLPIGLIVIDQSGFVKFINQYALNIQGIFSYTRKDGHYSDVISNSEILDTLHSDTFGSSKEIKIENVGFFKFGLEQVDHKRILLIRNITEEKNDLELSKDLILTASHDIRSPLTLIKGYISMLEVVGGLNIQQKTYIDKISTATEQINKISTELLDLQRVNSDSYLRIEDFNVSDLFEEIRKSIEPAASQKNISIVFGNDSNLKLRADKMLLNQALVNLLNNALEYSSIGNKVELHCISDEKVWCFKVIDQGAGIAPIDIPKLFTPGFRIGRTDNIEPNSSGFGLLIVKYITDLHHGKIWVESTLGKGSTFNLEIPRANDLTS